MQRLAGDRWQRRKCGTVPLSSSWLLLFAAAIACPGHLRSQGSTPAPPPGPPSATAPVGLAPSTMGPVQKVGPGNIKTDEVTTGVSVNATKLPMTSLAGRPAIGVALEGGGALGLAHIGVLQWMEEHHIPVDRIAGTSMGCLVSSLYATGRTTQEIEQITESDVFTRVLSLRSAYGNASFRRKQDRYDMPQALTLGLKHGVSFRNSLLGDADLNSLLESLLFSYDHDGIDFDRLPIPLRCVATDLNTMQPVIFKGGPVPEAVRASISIPGVFAPVIYQGHYLVDGAIMDNLPTDIVKQDLHADVVIGVHLIGPALDAGEVKSLVGVFARAYSAGTTANERRGEALADALVTVDTSKYSTASYGKAKEIVALGYAAAAADSPRLLKYAVNDAEWATYQAGRNGKKHHPPAVLQALKVEGRNASTTAFVAHDLAQLKGKQMTAEAITASLTEVQADGSLETRFETFAPDDPESKLRPVPAAPDTGLLVQFRPVSTGPPFLLVGPEVAAQTNNVTRTVFGFRLIDQNLGGYGSELRTDVRVGYLTHLATEYYRRLSPGNWYIQPRLVYGRQPVYIWSNQKRIAEQFEQQAGGGLDLGRTVNNRLQLHADWTAQVLRWRLVNGTPIGPGISGTSQTALFHVDYDNAGSGTVYGHGFRVDAAAGTLFRGPTGERAPLAQLAAIKSTTFFTKNLAVFAVDANTYFRHTVSQPIRFTLGGPFRLTASSLDEYRGTDTLLFRSAYLRQIATLPTGLGQGVYVTAAYEAGQIWSPERHAILRQDVSLGIAAATPLGGITFGTALGDAARRKVYFTFGRIF